MKSQPGLCSPIGAHGVCKLVPHSSARFAQWPKWQTFGFALVHDDEIMVREQVQV